MGKEKIHYLRTGSGSKLLIAFHGYGNDATMFLPLAKYLQPHYTLVSIDMPHHGNSKWNDDHMHPHVLQQLIETIIHEHKTNKVTLLGYSMGGRLCLKIAEMIPAIIDKVVLIASDGHVQNRFYYFVTRTKTGRAVFNNFLNKPQRYLSFINWCKNVKLLNPTKHKFAMQYVNEQHERELLGKVWPCMSYLIPNVRKLKKIIASSPVPIGVFMGRYDNIIPLRLAQRFKVEIPQAEIFVLPKGHKVMDDETMPQIADYIINA